VSAIVELPARATISMGIEPVGMDGFREPLLMKTSGPS
jgi:hypothetical protein